MSVAEAARRPAKPPSDGRHNSKIPRPARSAGSRDRQKQNAYRQSKGAQRHLPPSTSASKVSDLIDVSALTQSIQNSYLGKTSPSTSPVLRVRPDTNRPNPNRPAPSLSSNWDAISKDMADKWMEKRLGPEHIYAKTLNAETFDGIVSENLSYTPTPRFQGNKPGSAIHKNWADPYKTDGTSGDNVRVGWKENLIPDYRSVGMTDGDMAWKKLEGVHPNKGGWVGGNGGHGAQADTDYRMERRELTLADTIVNKKYFIDSPMATTEKYGTLLVPTAPGTLDDWKYIKRYGTIDRPNQEIKQMDDRNATKRAWVKEAETFKDMGLLTSDEMITKYQTFGRHHSYAAASKWGDGEHFARDHIKATDNKHSVVWTQEELKAFGHLFANTKEASERDERQLALYEAEEEYTKTRRAKKYPILPIVGMSMEHCIRQRTYGLTERDRDTFTRGRYSKVWKNRNGKKTEVINLNELKERFPMLEEYRSLEQCEDAVQDATGYGDTALSERCLEMKQFVESPTPISVILTEEQSREHRKMIKGVESRIPGCVDQKCTRPTCMTHGSYGRTGAKHNWNPDDIWEWHEDNPDFIAHNHTAALKMKPASSKGDRVPFKARPSKDSVMALRRKRYLKSQGLTVDTMDEDVDEPDTIQETQRPKTPRSKTGRGIRDEIDTLQSTEGLSKRQLKKLRRKQARSQRSSTSRGSGGEADSRQSTEGLSRRQRKKLRQKQREAERSNGGRSSSSSGRSRSSSSTASGKSLQSDSPGRGRKQEEQGNRKHSRSRSRSPDRPDQDTMGSELHESTGNRGRSRGSRSMDSRRSEGSEESSRTRDSGRSRGDKGRNTAPTTAPSSASTSGSTLEKLMKGLGVDRSQLTNLVREYVMKGVSSEGMSDSPLTAGMPSMITA